ncbi:MAG TPA: ABC transporter permease [Mucilaginibacter sp.]|nr:ABC transporter permease [Mucilaginibacter sp.]
MLRNQIRTALRSLLKNKGFTLINVGGLALGLAAFLLIALYVYDELSYDRFNIKHDRIYRVNTELKYGTKETSFAITAPPVADALANEFPEVEKSARIGSAVNIRLKKGDEAIEEKGAFYCDNNIFQIFTLPLIHGDAKTALAEHNTIVLSRSLALKYFNSDDVVGRTLFMLSDSSAHKITGVMADMPDQSHFRADLLLSMDPNKDNNWSHFNTGTYILLRKGSDAKKLEAKFDELIRRKMTTSSFNYDKFSAGGNYIRLDLTRVTDIHLYSDRQRELGINSNIQYVYIFSAIAVFILILACINFMNLSTARSAGRAREVGVRKVLGSTRRSLIMQFLLESVMVSLVAGIIAALAAWALLPVFNHISGKSLSLNAGVLSWFGPVLLLILLFTGLLAGAYPAFFLSAFKPARVLKGKSTAGHRGGFLRSFLVVFQFAISIFLIIGTLVIYNQLDYIRNKDLGYDRQQVLVIRGLNPIENPHIFKDQVKQLAGVINATLTHYLPASNISALNYITSGDHRQIETQFWPVDADYIPTLGMKIIQGRNFDERLQSDSSAVIINETLAKAIGYHGEKGAKIKMNKDYRIIGVVKDFNFASLRDNITPLILTMNDDWLASLSIRIKTTRLPVLMRQIENIWKTLAQGQHMDYTFMDDNFNALYDSEQRMGSVSVVFTVLAIFIACLGLFGLAAHAAEQRKREVSIRKVLGASIRSISVMLSKDFVGLVVLAMIIAAPLAWFAMHRWLQGFAYRQNIQWWIFAVTGLCALLVAILTVSYQSLKAAVVNPVNNLRSE